MKIGAQIRKFRMLRGMSQLDLALAIGYNGQGNVSRIEKDEQWPDGERLEAIAKALDINVSELFIYAEYASGEDEEENTHHLSELATAYINEGDDPTLDGALRTVEFELPATDPRHQAALAVEVYKAALSRQNTNRIVSAINSLTMAVESMKRE